MITEDLTDETLDMAYQQQLCRLFEVLVLAEDLNVGLERFKLGYDKLLNAERAVRAAILEE